MRYWDLRRLLSIGLSKRLIINKLWFCRRLFYLSLNSDLGTKKLSYMAQIGAKTHKIGFFFYVFPLFGVLACCTKIASYSVFLKDYRANKTVKPIICRGTAWFIDTTESLKWNNWERFLDATQHVSLHYRVCFSTL